MTERTGQLPGFAMPGVDQVGIVVRNVDQAVETYSSVFGIGPWDVFDMEWPEAVVHGQKRYVKARLAFAQSGPIQIELIQPLEGPSIYDEHLATKGEGLHHLGFLVPDLEERVADIAKRGVGVLQSTPTGRDGGVAYLDTAKSAGVILEYIKATRGMLRFYEHIRELGKAT